VFRVNRKVLSLDMKNSQRGADVQRHCFLCVILETIQKQTTDPIQSCCLVCANVHFFLLCLLITINIIINLLLSSPPSTKK